MRKGSGEPICSLDYHVSRTNSWVPACRLARRTAEVRRAVTQYSQRPIRSVLDVGTADGLMLRRLHALWPEARCVGVDLSRELLLVARCASASFVEANALYLPFSADTFDLVISTATIEHVTDPSLMVAECYRVLCPEGLCVVTTPDPLFERIATSIGHLPRAGHHETFSLRQLCQLFAGAGFIVEEADKFMVSPWGFQAEQVIERIMRLIGLRSMLLNQVIVLRKGRGDDAAVWKGHHPAAHRHPLR